MKCPHCLVEFHEGQAWWSVGIGNDTNNAWLLNRYFCPSCRQLVLYLESGAGPTVSQGAQNVRMQVTTRTMMVWPKAVSRAPIPPDVPPEIARDYKEACLVLADSANASAALSRRCLQTILKEKLGATKKDLYDQIEEVTTTGKLPSHIVDGLHAARNIGNIAAHTMRWFRVSKGLQPIPRKALDHQGPSWVGSACTKGFALIQSPVTDFVFWSAERDRWALGLGRGTTPSSTRAAALSAAKN